jgi:hypothetical protein
MLTGAKLGAAIEAARKKKGVTKKALADEFGVSAPSVQDWVKRGTIDKDKLSRLWLFFRDVAGPEHWGLHGWTEDQHLSGGVIVHPVAHDLSPPEYHSATIASLTVPIVGRLEMGAQNMFQLRAAPEGRPIGTVSVIRAIQNGYALQVFGDELYPAIRHGTCLVISPGAACTPGELAVLQMLDGCYVICEMVAEHSDAVTWSPAAGGPRCTTPRTELVAVLAVVGFVPGSQISWA